MNLIELSKAGIFLTIFIVQIMYQADPVGLVAVLHCWAQIKIKTSGNGSHLTNR